ncbi:MAG: hypothetical protein IT583_05850 [Verrucomicrobia bacterium]|nr:hypothetical protein [Verrucomicrobiota bacterium]
MDNQKFLLIKGEGGLGNRILSLLSGIEYARLSGRTPVVEWCDGQYSANGENAFFELFKETSHLRALSSLPASTDVTPDVWADSLFTSPFEKISPVRAIKASKVLTLVSLMLKRLKGSAFSFQFPWSYRKVCIDLSRTDQPQALGVFFSFTEKFYRLRKLYRRVNDPLMHVRDELKIKRVFERELFLKADIAEALSAERKRLLSAKTIGIHLRYTDRKGSLKRAFADVAKTVHSHPGWNLFLVTDNQQVEAALREKYPDLLTVKKWFPRAGGAIHWDGSCPDKTAMAADAVKELLLLSSCDYILYMGHSTFSVLARCLSGLPPARVLDMNRFHLLNRLVLLLHKVC